MKRALCSLALGSLHWACSTTPYGATDSNLERAQGRSALGAKLYERECAGCHGERGEGLASSPAIMAFAAASAAVFFFASAAGSAKRTDDSR